MIAISNAISIGLNRLGGGGPGPGPDPDAQAFFDRVAAAGGVLTEAETTAVNQLVLDMKTNGIWTSMKAIYPMVGASAAACAQNLVDSNFTGTFSSGITYASTGVTGNGSGAYMNTSLTPSISLTTANHHISFYSRTNASGSAVDMGVYEFTFGYSGPFMRTRTASNQLQYGMGTNTAFNDTLSSNTDSRGHFIGNILATNNRKTYINGAISGVNATSGNADSGTGPIFVLAVNRMPLLAGSFSIRQCAFASVGGGLTDTQASDFYTAVQTFQTTLNRQVV
jgi:hypothetical protein